MAGCQKDRVCFSALEERPELIVPENFIRQHQGTDTLREAIALPLAFVSSSLIAFFGRRCGPNSPDGISRRSQLVICHVCGFRCVTG
jgi:hypothetical protein